MKCRQGFVSNSSSSSFILYIHKISGEQLQQILDLQKKNDSFKESPWFFEIEEGLLKGTTDMDNFSMRDFFESIEISEYDYSFGD